ncbi:MAG: alpha-2-macroglobulin family protein [Hyphomicrobiales bacterium]|nr:alpha-2-macroglobulin family protein [Hyphomicrobiales bacterium]
MRRWIMCLAGALVLATGTQALADPPYQNADLARQGDRLQKLLPFVKTTRHTGIETAGAAFDAVLQHPDDAAAWLGYAKALDGASTPQQPAFSAYVHNAMAADYVAFEKAKDPAGKAQALRALSRLYASQNNWRPMLNAARASLALQDEAAFRSYYMAIREKFGFRILNYNIESDAKVPRACIEFSENLDKNALDYARFISVDGIDGPAVSASGNQLCVEGLHHGRAYHLVVRARVPSAVGEHSLHGAAYDIYVKDRSAQVHALAKNYVLPSVGQAGIPLTSVNADKLHIEILRVDDRSLIHTIRSRLFLRSLGSYQARALIERKGIVVWSGAMNVAEHLNRDVITAFPVRQTLGTMQPGVYVLLASVGDTRPGQPDPSGNYPAMATQWFVVSDLGLTSFSAPDGLHVMVRSLATARPVAGVTLRLITRSNAVLATMTSDADGLAHFDPGLSRGRKGLAPGLLTASLGKDDYNFLDLTAAPFDLTDRGDSGALQLTPLQALVFPERGVYRGGESVHITALLRKGDGAALAGLPLTLIVTRPDGVEAQRFVTPDQGAGGRSITLPLLAGAATGTWRIAAYADPKAAAIGEASFLVEDYVPDRLAMTMKPESQIAHLGDSVMIDTATRYLYGAVGANLPLTGAVRLSGADDSVLPAPMRGYQFGLADSSFADIVRRLDGQMTTGADGKARLVVKIPDAATQHPLSATISLTVSEIGGRGITRQSVVPILPHRPVIGVKPDFGDELAGNSDAGFRVALFDDTGQRMQGKALHWTLFHIHHHYQWFKRDGSWNFQSYDITTKSKEGDLVPKAGAPVNLTVPLTFGSYRLEITGDGAGTTSLTFHAGYSADDNSSSPDRLPLVLDKKAYESGDTIHAMIDADAAGEVTLAYDAGGLRILKSVALAKGGNAIDVKVGKDWGSGGYLVALAHRPLDVAKKRMPGRAIGIAWFGIDQDKHLLTIRAALPKTFAPQHSLQVPLTLQGVKAGDQAYVSVALVDAGILNLTHYKQPDAFGVLFGQRRLSAHIRDVYGHLIDGMQGTIGAVRSGGDASGSVGNAPKPSGPPLSLYAGPVKVGPDGKALVSFAIPDFNGTAQVMVTAWSGHGVGTLSQDVVIHDPVVMQASLPRFLNLADRSQMHVGLDNIAGAAGPYQLSITASAPLGLPPAAMQRSLTLARGGRADFDVPVTAARPGDGRLVLKLTGPGFSTTQNLVLSVLPGASRLFHREQQPLAPGASLQLNDQLTAEYLAGTGAADIHVAAQDAIDVGGLLSQLHAYAWRCSEQTVSRAMPLLFAASLPQALQGDPAERRTIDSAIARVLARQSSNGGFGLWSVEDDASVWLSAYVMDFLTRAHEQGHKVGHVALKAGLNFLANAVNNAEKVTPATGPGVAYALYVLARSGRPVMGVLRYDVATQLDAFYTPMARAQLGAALASLGDTQDARQVFGKALDQLSGQNKWSYSEADFGSLLRDSAGFVALAGESKIVPGMIAPAAAVLHRALDNAGYTSTQDDSWMVRAGAMLQGGNSAVKLALNGVPHQGAWQARLSAAALARQPVTLKNLSAAPVLVTVTTSGRPALPQAAQTNSYAISRRLVTLDGKPLPAGPIAQDTRFVVVLDLVEPKADMAQILVNDPLPAGLDIENPDLQAGAPGPALPPLAHRPQPLHEEFRDNRYVAAFTRSADAGGTYSLEYEVRAVTPGHYVWPAATIEDMYRPARFGTTAQTRLDVVGRR